MREIKFRAWDKVTNSWFRNGDGFALSWDATEIYDDNDECHSTEHIVFQQFTGLKDKNGKEIYEGDICRWSSWIIGTLNAIEENRRNDSVKWSDAKGLWFLDKDLWAMGIFSDVEVIGNIYEHPDLLNTEQNVQGSVARDDHSSNEAK